MSTRRLAFAALFAVAAVPATATTIFKSRIQEIAFGGGRMAFVANGLTVLESRTGRVIFREPESRRATFQERTDGILVGTSLWFRQSMRYRLFSTRGDPAWDVTCDLWHQAQGYLICAAPWHWTHAVIQVRSMVDGQIRWSFDTRGSGGEALDAKGRLMITNEDAEEEHYERAEKGYSVQGTYETARARSLTVLDIDTGRVIASTTLPGLRLSNSPNNEFDGDRVIYRVQPLNGCKGVDVYTFVVDAAAHGFTSSIQKCQSTDAPRADQESGRRREPEWSDSERQLLRRYYPLQEGGVAEFNAGPGTLLELRSERGRWQSMLEPDWAMERHPEVHQAIERDRHVFVESSDWTFGTIDALDLATGQPLWRYVFPAGSVFGSIGVFGAPDPPSPADLENRWLGVLSRPPRPLSRVVSVRPLEDYQRLEPGSLELEAPPTVIFDPAAVDAFHSMAIRLEVVWVALALGAAIAVAPWSRRFAPKQSLRRVLLAAGAFVYLTVMLLGVGVPSFFAGLGVRLLLVVVFVRTAGATLRLQTSRYQRVVRVALTLVLVLPFAALAFLLLL